MYLFPLKPTTMTSNVESILEFRVSKKNKKRHSITIGTPKFEKTTTAQIKSSNLEEYLNILKITHLKSISKLLVTFVLKKKRIC